MSTSEPSSAAASKDTIHWKNIVILLVIFVAGVFVGVATQYADRCPFLNPQPPASATVDNYPPRLNAKQRDYLHKLRDWKQPYQDKITASFTPEQKAKWEAMRAESLATYPPEELEAIEPPPMPEYPGAKPDRLTVVMTSIIAYQPRVDKLSKQLTLSDKQKAAVTKILAQRRDDFLKYIDQNPPPSGRRVFAPEEAPAPETEIEEP